jgi:hypothetical protein
VPPEKLLVYAMGEGWQPLCDFLGAEVPRGKPFPRLNDRQEGPKMMRRHMVAALAPRAVRAFATVSVLLAAAWVLRSFAPLEGAPGKRRVGAVHPTAGCGIPGS